MAWGDPANWGGDVNTEESIEVGVDATMSPSSTQGTVTLTLVPSMNAHQVATAVAAAWNSQRPIDFVVALPPTAGGPNPNRIVFTTTRPGSQINDILVGFQDKGLLPLEIGKPLSSTVNPTLNVTRQDQIPI